MAAPITQLRIFHRNFGSMYFLQESCKILARNIFSVRFLQEIYFLAESCKICIFCQDLARFLQDLHLFSTRGTIPIIQYIQNCIAKNSDRNTLCNFDSIPTFDLYLLMKTIALRI